jgi:hypothetical protein
MIISRNHGFAFIHNPKAAGTAVRKALEPFHDVSVEFWHQGWYEKQSRIIDLAHPTTDIWTAIPELEGLTTFGFVRDPYDRFESSIKEFERRHSKELGRMTKDRVLELLTPANIRYDWRFIHFCPQHFFFYLGNKCMVDKICRLENFDADWMSVNALIGNKFPSQVAKARVSHEDPDFDLLDYEDVLQHVNRLYLRDFLLFGYKMDGGLDVSHHSSRVEVIHDPAYAAFYRGSEESHVSFTEGELKSFKKSRAV